MRSFLFFLAICALCFACSAKKEEKQLLRLPFLTDVSSLDPRHAHENSAHYAIKMLFEGLLRTTPEGKIGPGVAERYEVSKDKKTYTFYLRPCKWSNGKEVTAYDFLYAWRGVINSAGSVGGITDFYPIKNAQRIMHGKLPLESMGVYAIDAKILVVELEEPTPYFLELTTSSLYSPVYQEADQHNREWAEKGGKGFICNGPYCLRQWRKNDELLLEKNPSYWNAPHVKIDEIRVIVIEDPETQLTLFEKGKLDWIGTPFTQLPLRMLPVLQDKGVLTLFPEKAVYGYFLNTEAPPFHNKKIRQAFAWALNRQEIVHQVLKENEEIALALNRSLYHHVTYFKDGDIHRAKMLFEEGLKELGMTRELCPPIAMTYWEGERNHQIAIAVQEEWKKVLGIEVSLDPQKWSPYCTKLFSGDFQIGGMVLQSKVQDPLYTLQIFQEKANPLNIARWENRRYRDLLTAAQKESDPTRRQSVLQKAESLLMSEMPLIPLYFLTQSYAKNKELHNVYLSGCNEVDFTWAFFDDASHAQEATDLRQSR